LHTEETTATAQLATPDTRRLAPTIALLVILLLTCIIIYDVVVPELHVRQLRNAVRQIKVGDKWVDAEAHLKAEGFNTMSTNSMPKYEIYGVFAAGRTSRLRRWITLAWSEARSRSHGEVPVYSSLLCPEVYVDTSGTVTKVNPND
jgi:hypothetical protein